MSAGFLRAAPGLLWLVDREHTLLVLRDTGELWRLREAEGMLWDWLAAGYPYARIRHLASLALSLPEHEAGALIASTLDAWVAAGILQRAE